jgi:hypothetical protein
MLLVYLTIKPTHALNSIVLILYALARHCTVQADNALAEAADPAAADGGGQEAQDAAGAGTDGQLDGTAAVAPEAAQELQAAQPQRQGAWARFGDAPSAMKLLLLSTFGL